MTNVLVGVLQVVIPALVAYAAGKGWISTTDLNELAAIFATIGSAIHSGMTTSVGAK